MFEPERENRLLNLAGNRAFLRQEQVLGELLGQRRAACSAAASSDIGAVSARTMPSGSIPNGSKSGGPPDGDESLGK